MLLEGRVALVTGASRGIGAATATRLAEHGAAVAVNYFHSGDAAAGVVRGIEAAGGRAVAVGADARDEAAVEAMVAEVARTLGPVDTLVINASIDFPTVPFTGLEWKDFEAKVMGEMRAAFFPLKAVVPSMIEARRGCIVGISSGLSRQPGFGFSAHSTAKSGLDALMKSLALELGPHGIRVNTVAPGLTLTDATARMPEEHKRASAARAPLRRNGVAGDVAGAVLMLASDESRFVTGAYVPVSGGNQMI